MNAWVSLLRGINVGPTKTVGMEDLVSLYESLGLENIRTYLRSGNVLFDSPGKDPKELSAILEERITRAVGFPVKVLVRTGDELQEIIIRNPFSSGESHHSTGLHVTFLSEVPSKTLLNEANKIKNEADRFIVYG